MKSVLYVGMSRAQSLLVLMIGRHAETWSCTTYLAFPSFIETTVGPLSLLKETQPPHKHRGDAYNV